MPRPLITIAGETREMNDAEFAQYEKDQADAAAEKARLIQAEAQKKALLNKLGLTEEEVRLLLG